MFATSQRSFVSLQRALGGFSAADSEIRESTGSAEMQRRVRKCRVQSAICAPISATLESARARMGLDERRKEQDERRDLKGNG